MEGAGIRFFHLSGESIARMREHLTEQQVESFRRRKLSPDGLRTAHQHIAVCETCRARLSTPVQAASAFTAFERELGQEDAEDAHLRYQELSGYVDDELGEIDREIVEAHLETCAECEAEVRDLRAFKSIISAGEHENVEIPSSSARALGGWSHWTNWNPVHAAVAAAMAVLIILTAAFFLLRNRVSHQGQAQLSPSPQVHDGGTAQTTTALPSPPARTSNEPSSVPENASDNNRARPSRTLEKRQRRNGNGKGSEGESTTSAQIVVALKDGDGLLTLDSRACVRRRRTRARRAKDARNGPAVTAPGKVSGP
jgi:hypothetical protein